MSSTNSQRQTYKDGLSILALSAFLIGTQTMAQDNDDSPEHDSKASIDEIIVSATRTPKPINAMPNMISIIGSEDLSQQTNIANDIAGMLGHLVPGFSPSRQKMSGFGESFRGRSPLYLIDGVPQTNPLRDSSRDGYTIDMSVIERVEVIHGANAIQGLGATGGLINFVTKKPPMDGDLHYGARASITTGDGFNSDGFEGKTSLYASQKIGPFDYLASVAIGKRGLFYDGSGRAIAVDATQGDLADSQDRNLFLKLGFEPTDQQRFDLMINDFKLAGDGDYIGLAGDRSTGTPATSIKGDIEGEPATNDVTTITATYQHQAIAGGTLNLQAFSQDFRASFGGGTFASFQDPALAEVGTLFDQSENNSEKLGARATWFNEGLLDGYFSVFTGLDFLKDKTFQRLKQSGRNWVPETRFESFAPFLQTEIRAFESLRLSAGLRYENATLKVADYQTIAGNRRATDYAVLTVTGGSPSFDDLLFNTGLVFDVTDHWSVFSSYQQGYTMPDVGRVLRGISTEGVNVNSLFDLSPVKADNIEAGFNYSSDSLKIKASAYQSASNDGARYVADSEGFLSVKREKTRIQGIELLAEMVLNEGWRLGTNVTVQRGRVDSNGDDILDADLDAVNIGTDRLNMFIAYNLEKLNARLQVAHLFDRNFSNAADAQAAQFNGYHLVDLTIGYDLAIGKVQLSAQNLLDKTYVTYYSQAGRTDNARFFTGRGRSLTLSYSLDF